MALDDDAPRIQLASLLSRLKDESGLSYAELARRTLTTASTLHRYCTGAVVPSDYRVVASIAEETGADGEALAALAVAWSQARAARTGRVTAAPYHSRRSLDGSQGHCPAPLPAEGPLARSPGVAARRSDRASTWTRVGWLGVVLCLLACASAATPSGLLPAPAISAAPARAEQGGALWTAYPWPLGADSMGVTVNSNTGRMPSFGIGSVRFWDSGTRWADLEPSRLHYSWGALDRLVAGARRAGLPSLYVAGGTPGWTAPNGPRSLYADGSRTAPPDDLAQWGRFVQALVSRYHGRIGAYELWDTATDAHFYAGSPRTLALMARSAATIVHRTDPHASVVCPSVGDAATPGGSPFLRAFAAAGGFAQCDVVAVKVRQEPADVPPEDITTQIERFEEALHDLGVAAPVWITGPDYDISRARPLHGSAAADWAVRFYLAMVYERLNHVQRAYFYDWGGSALPVVLQQERQAATPAGLAVGRLHHWLEGADIAGCGHGHAAKLPPNAWRCTFTHTATPHGRAVIAWTQHGTTRIAAPYRHTTVQHLDGTTTAAATSVQLGEAPVLLTP